jgi:hypothetical protein
VNSSSCSRFPNSCEIFQRGAFVINKVKAECDPSIVNLTYSMRTEKGQDTRLNITVDVLVASIDSLVVFMNVSIPENDGDKKYKRLMMANEYDTARMGHNVMTMTLTDILVKSMKTLPKLPIPKVRLVLKLPERLLLKLCVFRVNFRA